MSDARDESLNAPMISRNDAGLMIENARLFGLLLALAPVVAGASPYDGTYKQTETAECSLVGVDGGSLKIENNIFYGVEVECRMTDPVEVEEMGATLYQMQCTGEGEIWAERAMLMPDADETGLYMVWRGYAFRYARCEPGEY